MQSSSSAAHGWDEEPSGLAPGELPVDGVVPPEDGAGVDEDPWPGGTGDGPGCGSGVGPELGVVGAVSQMK